MCVASDADMSQKDGHLLSADDQTVRLQALESAMSAK